MPGGLVTKPSAESLKIARKIVLKWDQRIIVDHNRIGITELLHLERAIAKAIANAREANDVYYNNGKNPVFITTEFHADPNGGPGIVDEQICVAPGEGIDLSIIGFSRALEKARGE